MLRSHVQITLLTPDFGVETQPTPGTHVSSVHGSPSSQADASSQDAPGGEGGGGGGGEIEPSILIGWLRATGTGRLEPGAGLSSRSSYQPAAQVGGQQERQPGRRRRPASASR